MREHEVFDRVGDVANVAAQLPHAADHVARLFRDSGHWRDLTDWYVSYAKRWSPRLPWSVAQLGTMFPSGEAADSGVADLFAEVLAGPNAALPLLSLAAQRLAAWKPDDARVLLRDAANKESHPLARRTLGLASIHAGEVKNVVRKLLQQHEENALILAMLEDSDFEATAAPVAADFAG
jgi:hypothetical protein